MKVKNKVKYHRVMQGLTLQGLADKMGSVKSTISYIENGNCDGLTMGKAYMIADALGMDVNDLFFYVKDDVTLTIHQCERLMAKTGICFFFDKNKMRNVSYDAIMKLF